MSVATEFAPQVTIPARASVSGAAARPALRAAPALPAPGVRPARERSGPVAPAAVLRPPADRAPVRLTRRGVVVLGVALGLLAFSLVALARLSAPSAGGPAPAGPRVVTVQPGDTLWGIATRVAPEVDPRLEVDQLRKLNSLDAGDLGGLVPGQQLRTR